VAGIERPETSHACAIATVSMTDRALSFWVTGNVACSGGSQAQITPSLPHTRQRACIHGIIAGHKGPHCEGSRNTGCVTRVHAQMRLGRASDRLTARYDCEGCRRKCRQHLPCTSSQHFVLLSVPDKRCAILYCSSAYFLRFQRLSQQHAAKNSLQVVKVEAIAESLPSGGCDHLPYLLPTGARIAGLCTRTAGADSAVAHASADR
jgi:hypothetical protein